MRRSRAQSAAQTAGSSDFVIDDVKKLGSSLAASLSRQLERKHLRACFFRTPRGESLRIADALPLYRDDVQQCPVLQLKAAEVSAGAYLEVALDYEYTGGVCGLTHVSLKVHTGQSPRVSALRFRAEWDPRSETQMHAQPHWNIDQIGGSEGSASSSLSTAFPAPWASEVKIAPWAAPTAVTQAPRTLDLRKMHFAMGSTWHLPVIGEDRRHSAPFVDEDALLRWVTGCAGYIRAQLTHA